MPTTETIVLHTWRLGDPQPPLPHPLGFAAGPTDDDGLVARLAGLDRATVRARRRAGHRPYVAWLDGTPVAYGWSAGRRASIGEIGVRLALRPGAHYLWDFATLPAWRGRGVYPALLRAIVAHETPEAERFLIGHRASNLTSRRGIEKAGFRELGMLRPRPGGGAELVPAA